MFNFMMGSAYNDGADYLYRINDDTEFKDAWAATAIAALKRRTPPNIGVVGPICKQVGCSYSCGRGCECFLCASFCIARLCACG